MLIKPIKRVEMSIKPTRHEEMSIKPIKKGELPIKPVSIHNSNINFGATVKSNTTINKGFEMAFNLLENPTLKDLESCKSFYDSMRKILATDEIKVFGMELAKGKERVYPVVNGSKLDVTIGCPYVQDSYIVQEGCKKFADSLPVTLSKSALDEISKRIFKMREQLVKEEEKYKETLISELQKMQKSIA